MRHVLRVDFLADKIEKDLWRRAVTIARAVADRGPSPEADAVQAKLRAASKWMCRVASRVAHRPFTFHEGVSLDALLESSFRSAVDSLRHADPGLFRRRAPFHHFCTSEAESVFAAVLAAASLIEESIPLALKIAPDAAEQIYPPAFELPARIA